MLLTASFGLSVLAQAEREAPQIIKEIEDLKQAPAEAPVPIALQHSHPEAIAPVETPSRSPTASNENYKSPISHSLEVPNYAEYIDAVQKGDKTSAQLPAEAAVPSE